MRSAVSGFAPRALVAAVVAVATALVTAGNAMAAETQVDRWRAQMLELEQVADTMTAATPERTLEVLESLPADALATSSGAVPTGEVASWVTAEGEELLVVALEDDLGLSSLTLRLDGSEVKQSVEIAVAASNRGVVQTRQWTNGALVSTETILSESPRQISRSLTTAAGTTSSTQSVNPTLAGAKTRVGATVNAKWHPFSWLRFKSCMLDAQVSWALLAIFATARGAGAVVTAGLALFGCAAAVGLPSGAMGACTAYATYW
ncbi:hypothetical protein [Cellulomonas sp. FA1]|uniref:hypothetical protein n=1 Tax=Cellulomonas sp. FA1 TaxID=1346710 RepID=UPI000A6141FA|nr:hypothetical protein [Cellulomonas sp. FA1]